MFGILDDLVAAGKIRYYGVSVETVDEALRAIRHPNVQSVQIIFNMFRLKPAEAFFPAAKARQVGRPRARSPGQRASDRQAAGRLRVRGRRPPAASTERAQAFDKGETFSGVPYEVGLQAVEALRPLVPEGATLAQLALRYILMFDAVSCAIPGAKNPAQARDNAAAAALPPLAPATMAAVRAVYDERIRPHVHASW